MKTVLPVDGLGTRMRVETELRPKPTVEIWGKPLIWDPMKFFTTQRQLLMTNISVCSIADL